MISDEIFQLLTRLNRTGEEFSHLGFLNLVDQLVDLGYQEEDRNIRISQYLESMMQDVHSQTLFETIGVCKRTGVMELRVDAGTLASGGQFLSVGVYRVGSERLVQQSSTLKG